MNKKLYKVAQGKVLCGVCGGVAAVLCCFAGAGIVAYIVAAIVMPEKPSNIIDQAE